MVFIGKEIIYVFIYLLIVVVLVVINMETTVTGNATIIPNIRHKVNPIPI